MKCNSLKLPVNKTESGAMNLFTMRRIPYELRTTGLLLLFIISTSCSSKERIEESKVLEPELPAKKNLEKLHTYLHHHFENGEFSGVVLLADDEKILFERVFGYESFKNKEPLQVNSRFAIGSISKTFCAAAIIKLQELNKLNINDPINLHIDIFLDNGITIKQLLLHKSGIPRFESQKKSPNLGELLKGIEKKAFLFKPGNGQEYSNEGYSLLAFLIEKVSGMSYSDFLQEYFFKPLKMNDSGVFPYTDMEVVSGHSISPNGPVLSSPNNFHYMIGSGSNYSSAYDLLSWTRAMSKGQIIDMKKLDYPYGWGKTEVNIFDTQKDEHRIIHQSGLVTGYTAYTSFYIDDNLFLIFLTNISSGFFNIAQEDIRDIWFGKPHRQPDKINTKGLNKEEIQDYIGHYETEDKFPFKIKSKDSALYIEWGNGAHDDVLLSPISKDVFLNRNDFTKNTFHRNKNGKITGLTISIKDTELKCIRK